MCRPILGLNTLCTHFVHTTIDKTESIRINRDLCKMKIVGLFGQVFLICYGVFAFTRQGSEVQILLSPARVRIGSQGAGLTVKYAQAFMLK